MQQTTTQQYKRNEILIHAVTWMNLENIMGVTESRKREYILYYSIYETLETVNLISIHQKHVIGCLRQIWEGLNEMRYKGTFWDDGNFLDLNYGGGYTSI